MTGALDTVPMRLLQLEHLVHVAIEVGASDAIALFRRRQRQACSLADASYAPLMQAELTGGRAAAPNKRERRVLNLLAGGAALPASEFYQVGIETLARMAGKGWISYERQRRPDRVIYLITSLGAEARDSARA